MNEHKERVRMEREAKRAEYVETQKRRWQKAVEKAVGFPEQETLRALVVGGLAYEELDEDDILLALHGAMDISGPTCVACRMLHESLPYDEKLGGASPDVAADRITPEEYDVALEDALRGRPLYQTDEERRKHEALQDFREKYLLLMQSTTNYARAVNAVDDTRSTAYRAGLTKEELEAAKVNIINELAAESTVTYDYPELMAKLAKKKRKLDRADDAFQRMYERCRNAGLTPETIERGLAEAEAGNEEPVKGDTQS
ncbi:hypothetical protein KHQ84_gp103 [Rhodococcus phage Finch]|uniref:Uncharacterized protein n=1 Tax=Rhodococcus phage Finch TaxID=2094144 RepID=A0A2P1JXH5_9CAUD|nr:hypothetical protein KHQ84_gp103 [Rhodococcus phage Finch]AVO25035.1 hypothetical protein SEA_FINCH_103 [Rhodococcus phage Finch]